MSRVSKVVAAALVLAPIPALAQPACENLIVTGHPEYPPIGYATDGAIAGAGAMVVETLSAMFAVPVQPIDFGSWEAAQAAARSGEADIIFGIYYNDERATYLDYVEPAFTLDPVVVFAPAGTLSAFSGRDDLIGLRGVTNQGESFGVELDAFIEESLDLARVDGVDVAFQTLLSGDADYMIFGLYPGLAELRAAGVADQVDVLEPHLLEAEMFIAFSKESPCLSLIEPFGEAIATMRDNGEIDALIDLADSQWLQLAF